MLAALAKYKLIPTLDTKELTENEALKCCEALVKGGLPLLEIPFRRHSDSLALKAIAKELPDFYLGTSGIINTEQLMRAVECNVKFASAPGVCPETMALAAKQAVAFIPGVLTPSDIQAVLLNGFADFQFFPAEVSGGADYLKTILEPFEHLPLDIFPKGGIKLKQLEDYLEIPHVTAVAFDQIALPKYIKKKQWDKITEAAKKALDAIN